jgi:2-C-methyl-D-erythritol 4-phosphate cytidylyltransferase/2-C-methyl-D-erythritol 2,4-cyclodiphosphate synthase
MDIKRLFCPSRAEAVTRLRALCGASNALVCVIPAAGRGERSGLGIPKQYHVVAGQTVLARSVRTIADYTPVAAVVVVLSPDDGNWFACGLEDALAGLTNVVAVAIGGASRRDSVMAGCTLVHDAIGGLTPWVMVHDAARPGVRVQSLERLWGSVQGLPCDSRDGAILALPVSDTIKRAADPRAGDGMGAPRVKNTVSRESLWAAQTPQLFRLEPLVAAYQSQPAATDEASAMEAAGGEVRLVMGNAENFKLTTADDFLVMEALMAQSQEGLPFAVGQGFDVHALVTGRPLIIGGVTIPYEKGLAGHSDADVLLHAITDAILGAACLGDIGRLFPDTDPAFEGADSRVLLREAVSRVQARGWRVAHVDATVIAQAPKISPYAKAMQESIAQCCGVAIDRVNIKGKTTEKLGFTGRGEGIAAQAMATLARARS